MSLRNLVEQYSKQFGLTSRETELFSLLIQRVTSPAELAKQLKISVHTVNNHLKNILEKTQSDSKTELLADFLLFLDKQRFKLNLPTHRPKVLIIDDESDLVSVIQDYLKAEDIECFCYSDPLTALEDIRKLKVDVVISDIKMPKMNGVDFLKEIRKIHHYEPGMIFISGYTDEFSLENLLDQGAFALLPKPIDLDRMYRLIWEYVWEKAPPSRSELRALIQIDDSVPLSSSEIGFGASF